MILVQAGGGKEGSPAPKAQGRQSLGAKYRYDAGTSSHVMQNAASMGGIPVACCVKYNSAGSPGDRKQRSPMKTHILRGSKQEIAESLVRISGEVHEAIVFEEES